MPELTPRRATPPVASASPQPRSARPSRPQGGTAAEFARAFTIDANRSLTITLHEVYPALATTPIEGPAGVEASFDFRGASTRRRRG